MRPLIDHAKRDRAMRIARESLTPRQLAVYLEDKGFSRHDACRIAKFDEHAEHQKAVRVFLLVVTFAALLVGLVLKFFPDETQAQPVVIGATKGSTLLVISEHLRNHRVGYFETVYPDSTACEEAKRNVVSRTHKTWRFCK